MSATLDLCDRSRRAWIAWVAPQLPGVIDANDDAELARGWRVMGRDLQRAAWQFLNTEQRTRLRRVCAR